MAESAPAMVYQFKVTLEGTRPPVWRRIQVPADYSFCGLHHAIQSTMEWIDMYQHHFRVRNPRTLETEFISFNDDEEEDGPSLMSMLYDYKYGRTHFIADYFLVPRDRAVYTYDFCDRWRHQVVLEKIVPAREGEQYPKCVDGRNAGPPEDCGGVAGYARLKRILADPNHRKHREMLEELSWSSWRRDGDFDPFKFDPEAVGFRDPKLDYRVRGEPNGCCIS